MTARRLAIALLTLIFVSHAPAAIKVACVGDSITAGDGSSNPAVTAYPAVLQALLGAGYDVRNFGRGGACTIRSGNQPYVNDVYFADSTNFLPDLVVIMLGTNDGKPYNWDDKANFTNDYDFITGTYSNCASRPRILVCAPCPALGDVWDIVASTVNNEIVPGVRQYAASRGFRLIEVNGRMTGHPEWFGDPVHPNDAGYAQIADVVRITITNVMAIDNSTKLVPLGATWKYHNTGALPDPNWSATGYGDGSWSNGAAPLGYDDTAIVTPLSYGGDAGNKWSTYYFRKHFTVTTPAAVTGLQARLFADDGAIVYLNGVKVHTTTNMPVPSDNGSWAVPYVPEPYAPLDFTILPGQLVTGDNVLAVEVHQATPGSSDLYFDLSLGVLGYATTNQPGGGFPATNVPPDYTDPSASWAAYNDLAWASGQVAVNLTKLSFVDDADHDLSGRLLKYADGTQTPVTMSLSPVYGGGLWVTTDVGTPNAGTPGYLYFDGKVDLDRTVFMPATSNGTITLSGMDPARKYKVVLLGNRNESNYTTRTTVITLSGAASFTNASTPGAMVSGAAGETTTIVTGTNMGGQVFVYTDIMAGSDAEVRLAVGSEGGNIYSWYLNGMAVELLPATTIVDTDTDGMDDAWEQSNFGGLTQPASGDYDNDGSSNYNEYRAGTNPNAAGSRLEVADAVAVTGNQMVLSWASVAGKSYAVQQATGLSTAWSTLQAGVGATAPLNVYTATLAQASGFLRVRVE